MKSGPLPLVYSAVALLVAAAGQLVLPPKAPPVLEQAEAASLIGTSLARTTDHGLNLSQALTRALQGEGVVFKNASVDGAHLGDLFAAAVRDTEAGAELTLVEVNFFNFNERRHLLAARPDKIVCRKEKNIPLLYSVGSGRLDYELFRQDGVEEVLTQLMSEHFGPYYWGKGSRERAAKLVREQVSTQYVPPEISPEELERAMEARKHEVMRANFAHKELQGGTDSIVLADFMDWAERESSRTRTVFYFPPLNASLIDELAPADPVFEDVLAWVASWRAAARERGIEVLDYTSLLTERSELFEDYGHLVAAGLLELADAMATDLRMKKLLPGS